MDDNEMQRRLELVQAAKTAILGVTNAILRVLPNAVEVCSDRTSNPRVITFNEIRRGSTSHSAMVNALRQILGLA